ncbi:hypothetical protein Ddye_007485 [Dipteronia dyeriana]|uniref:Uncharacterized protein n=1 Tax=Dipteronia dyeriana TaxID=168575 RepID=A0AAD9XKB9_9ROSI|nr:hypothetical protein Ddye_007485 [Dipteronia dyeriana]
MYDHYEEREAIHLAQGIPKKAMEMGQNLLENFNFNVAGYVIGLPLTKEKDNPEVAKVKNFVADLYSTRRLEGLKYTYLYESSASKYLAKVRQDPEKSYLYEMLVGEEIIQEYYNLHLKDHYPLEEDEDDE